jgi:hypothetical protein
MKKNEGYILLKSLLTMAVVIICVAALYTTLATAVRQSWHLKKHILEELSFRTEKIMERVK